MKIQRRIIIMIFPDHFTHIIIYKLMTEQTRSLYGWEGNFMPRRYLSAQLLANRQITYMLDKSKHRSPDTTRESRKPIDLSQVTWISISRILCRLTVL